VENSPAGSPYVATGKRRKREIKYLEGRCWFHLSLLADKFNANSTAYNLSNPSTKDFFLPMHGIKRCLWPPFFHRRILEPGFFGSIEKHNTKFESILNN
jgi:hypothetical protein